MSLVGELVPLLDQVETAGAGLDEDLLVDLVSLEGQLEWCNSAQIGVLGFHGRPVRGIDLGAVYEESTARALRRLLSSFSGNYETATSLEAGLIAMGGRTIRTVARARFVEIEGHSYLRLTKTELGQVAAQYKELETEANMLRNILQTSTQAHWAIEFLDPVDVTQPVDEVIRQVFENQSVWRMCNDAMARLYDLPDSLNFNDQDVRLYWPRSEANELFVRDIVASGYAINDATSIDRAYDGTLRYISNDVRAEITDGLLLRLWGNCRDITAESLLRHQSSAAENATALVHRVNEPSVLIDNEGRVAASNKSFDALAKTAKSLVDRLTKALAAQSRSSSCVSLEIPEIDGETRRFDVFLQTGVAPDQWAIGTFVPVRNRTRKMG
ncbi:MAG TPA: hypothetical protein VN112_18120 [Ensifer sp.]|nr:hypothetical protein [Ensifer sp.]